MPACKTEGLEEEEEVGGDVRGSPWLNLVIRASRGVGWEGGYTETGIADGILQFPYFSSQKNNYYCFSTQSV